MSKLLILLLLFSLNVFGSFGNSRVTKTDEIRDNGSGDIIANPLDDFIVAYLTASKALVTGTNKELVSSTTTAAQIEFLNTISSNVQTQIDSKVPLTRTLTGASDILIDGVNTAQSLASNRTITCRSASGSQSGCLASADYTTFNNKVSATRAINTTSPLTGGGDLSADRTISIPAATGSQNGYLTSVDWTSFNSKLSSLNALTGNTQLFAVGTSGSDFNISSVTATHTFNLPTASAANRGALSSTDWSTFNSKQSALVNSAGLAAALNDEQGTGSSVFSNNPTLTNPVVGTQAAGNNSTLAASTAYADRAVADVVATSAVFPNGVINGNLDFAQKGDSFVVVADTLTETIDRFNLENVSSDASVSRVDVTQPSTESFNSRFWLQNNYTAGVGSTAKNLIRHSIEDVYTYACQQVTLSFWAESVTTSENIAVEFGQFFGTGGSPSATVTGIGVTTHLITTTPTKFTQTTTIPCVNGKTFGTTSQTTATDINFWYSCGSNFSARCNSLGLQDGVVRITSIKLEKGPSATPFVLSGTTLAGEAQNVQRYFVKSNAVSGTTLKSTTVTNDIRRRTNGTSDRWEVRYPRPMRVTPTPVVYSYDTGTNNRCFDNTSSSDRTITIAEDGSMGFAIQFSASVDGNSVGCHYYSSAEYTHSY